MASTKINKKNKADIFDIFISYNWDVKPHVLNLYKVLTETFHFSVWLDDYEMGATRLNDGNRFQALLVNIQKWLSTFFVVN